MSEAISNNQRRKRREIVDLDESDEEIERLQAQLHQAQAAKRRRKEENAYRELFIKFT